MDKVVVMSDQRINELIDDFKKQLLEICIEKSDNSHEAIHNYVNNVSIICAQIILTTHQDVINHLSKGKKK